MFLGHDDVIDVLNRHITNKKTSHVYLFHGIEGIGRINVALAFIKALENNAQVNRALQLELTCPDVVYMNGERLTIDMARVAVDRFYKPRWELNNKYLIVDDISRATKEAITSMLKLVEEPLNGRRIIILASDISGLPSTFLSRCYHIRFSPLSQSQIAEIFEGLGENFTISDDWYNEARGSVGRLLRLKDTFDIDKLKNEFLHSLNSGRHSKYLLKIMTEEDLVETLKMFAMWIKSFDMATVIEKAFEYLNANVNKKMIVSYICNNMF